jgi:4-amino-4-deoxy-L-arabinose transferase-like glycosyltransferase
MDKLRIYQIILIALFLRVAWSIFLGVEPVSDSNMYLQFALTIMKEGSYAYPDGNLTAYWPVGTSALYASLFFLFGTSDIVIECFNLCVGLINVYLIYKVSTFYFNLKVAKIAAIIFAFWPLMIQMTTVIASEMIFLTVCLLALFCWNHFRSKPVVIGLGCYIRPTIILFLLIMPIIDSVTYSWKHSVKIFIPLLIVILITAPWAFRNTELFEYPTFISTNFGTNLWMGNNVNTTGAYMRLPDSIIGLNEKERENELKQEAIEYITDDPARYFGLIIKRALLTFDRETIGVHWNLPQLKKLTSESGINAIKIISTAFWLIVLSLSVFGLIISLFKEKFNKIFFHPTALYFYFMSIPLLTVGQDRYHISMTVYIAMFAAYSISQLIELLKRKNTNILKSI